MTDNKKARCEDYGRTARGKAAQGRDVATLTAFVLDHDLTTDDGARTLADDIGRTWTCLEVKRMHAYLLACGLTPDRAETAVVLAPLRLFFATLASCVDLFLGGACVVAARGWNELLDLTLDDLARLLPDEAKRKLDAVAAIQNAFGNLAPQVKTAAREGAREAVEKAVPKAYRKAATAEPGEDPFAPKTRNPGGGRKAKYDPDRKQVDAVVEAILTDEKNGTRNGKPVEKYALPLFRKPPEGTRTPYPTLDKLAQAVKNRLDSLSRRS